MITESEKKNMELVQAAMDGILVNHDESSVEAHFHPRFVQHNPWAKDGAAHVKEMCAFTFGLKAVRWAVQGDLVAYHGLYTAPNPLGDHPLVCVDIWRVQGDQIVEHWDALMPAPAQDAEQMIEGAGDGLAPVANAEVANNAAAARELLETGLVRRDEQTLERWLAPSFRMHGPAGGDSHAFLAQSDGATARVDIKRTVASGDLVFVHLLLETLNASTVLYNIFRFDESGRATDLWSVRQSIVSPGEAANSHPHF